MNENIWKSKWSKEQIRAMLLEQQQSFWQRPTGIQRNRLQDIEQAAHLPHAVVLSGLRRVGKSTLLAQLAHRLGKDSFYYLNFEDDRFLGFQASDANDLFQAMVELFGERRIFIVDEVQNIPAWEHFVRRFIDMGYKFYLSGSNAALLSRELGTLLTGRYLPIELFPFSFDEFLQFQGIAPPDLERLTTIKRGLLQQNWNNYLRWGGIPDALKYLELPLLRTLYDDVLYRDIATRYHIEEVRALKELAFYLMSNPASPVSYNKLKDQFRLGSVNTIKNYIEYLENSWLIFTINLFDYSVKRQQIAPKKVYPIDTGMANAVGFTLSPNTGKLFETAIFLSLRQRSGEIYYYRTSKEYEVDFYLPQSGELIQAAQHMENPTTQAREVRALVHAMSDLGHDHGLIITETDVLSVDSEGQVQTLQPLAAWLRLDYNND